MSARWLGFERRWRDDLSAAILPASGLLPGIEQVDTEPTWQRLLDSAPAAFLVAIRAAVWLLTLCPPFVVGRPALFGRLRAEDQDLVLTRAQASRWTAVRLLTTALRISALLCYFTDPMIDRAVRDGGSDG
jgi:hypothetical protein